jgi:WhiB family redox-sensing transcriptional regulator
VVTALELGRPDWQTHGLCLDYDPTLWFPTRGAHYQRAVDICNRCPVRDQCLQYALDNSIKFGVWGGKSERQRRALRHLRLITGDSHA